MIGVNFSPFGSVLALCLELTARDIENNNGSCLWIDKGGIVSIDDLEGLLLRACAVPAPPAPGLARRGDADR
jgi:hypothetical protein